MTGALSTAVNYRNFQKMYGRHSVLSSKLKKLPENVPQALCAQRWTRNFQKMYGRRSEHCSEPQKLPENVRQALCAQQQTTETSKKSMACALCTTVEELNKFDLEKLSPRNDFLPSEFYGPYVWDFMIPRRRTDFSLSAYRYAVGTVFRITTDTVLT